MNIIYSNQPPLEQPTECVSIFLVGPTPRSSEVPSWRPLAIQYLEDLGFNGTVLIPEYDTKKAFSNYDNQVWWERKGLINCTKIIAWVPRNMETMPALTTNIELGYWLAKQPQKVFFGRPDGAPHTAYLDWLYQLETSRSPFNNLKTMLEEVLFKKENQ